MTACDLESAESTEKYLLGKMSEERAAQFEEHCFACETCFERLQEIDQLKAFLKDAPDPLHDPGGLDRLWAFFAAVFRPALSPVPIAAFVLGVVLAGAFGWREMNDLRGQLFQARRPVASVPEVFLSMTLRELPEYEGESQDHAPVLQRGAGPSQLTFHLLDERSGDGRLDVEILDPRSTVVWTAEFLRAVNEFGTYTILIQPEFFEAGTHTLRVVRPLAGGARTPVEEWPFLIVE
jgi:hypothetical protein